MAVRLITPQGEEQDFINFRVFFDRIYGGVSYHTLAAEGYWDEPLPHFVQGADITGNGIPNLIFEGYSGGAHCCYAYRIYELGDEPKVLFEGELDHSPLYFNDLNLID